MTTYILAGGQDRKSINYWKHLAKEINPKRPLKVLSCFFSQPQDHWDEKFKGFIEFFKITFGEDAKFVLANIKDFQKQVQEADIVYLHGGTTKLLANELDKYPELEKMFENKIVIGSSAGANYLSTICWSPSIQKVISGSSILPLGVMVHYGSSFDGEVNLKPSDWKNAEIELKSKIASGMPLLKIREGEFVVINK